MTDIQQTHKNTQLLADSTGKAHIIEIQGLNKSFGDMQVLHDITFYIRNNEFMTLLGPSGCGKSTTLRILGGFETADSGDVRFEGQDLLKIPAHKRQLNTVFQRYALFPHLNVFDNVAFGLRLKKVGKVETKTRVEEALATVGLSGYGSRWVDQLSGGQMQRVAIARAIINRPRILLLDEPLGALDLKMRKEMQIELKEMQRELGITFVYVTHDQEEALTMSDTIIVMKDGFIQQIGTPQAVFDHPANLFVASFIGVPQMNFFDAGLKAAENGYTVSVAGAEIAVSPALNEKLRAASAPAGPVTLGIRPEHIALCYAGTPNAITGRVDVSEMMGSSVHVHATVDGTDVVMVLQTMDIAEEFHGSFKSGMDITFNFNSASIHLFSRETGDNLI